MSNACKNSLLVIAAVIICIATPLLTSKVIAQSELMFRVNSQVSYTAPSLDNVFAGVVYTYEPVTVTPATISVAKPTATKNSVTKVVARTSPEVKLNSGKVSINTEKTEKETPVSQSNIDTDVSMGNSFLSQSTQMFPVKRTASYSAPSLDAVFTDQEYREVTTITVVTRDETRKNIQKKMEKIERLIAEAEKQISVLEEEFMSTNGFGCGSCGSHVKDLQKFLNKNGHALASDGPGSVGQETKFFGPRTLKALKRFQSAYGIPVTGTVDAETKKIIKSIDQNAIGEITAENCISQPVQEGKKPQKKIVEIPQDDAKRTSGSFFTNLIQKIFGFFTNLFQ